MIIKGNTHRGGPRLAAHLLKTEENERVRVLGSRDLLSRTITDAVVEMELVASTYDNPNIAPLWHVSANSDPGEAPLTAVQWQRLWDLYEQEHDLVGVQYMEVEHLKNGRSHRHRVYCRVDVMTGELRRQGWSPDPEHHPKAWSKRVDSKVCRMLELEFGHKIIPDKAWNNRHVLLQLRHDGMDDIAERLEVEFKRKQAPDAARISDADRRQAQRTGRKPMEIKRLIAAAWRASDSLESFQVALAEEGMTLAQGDKKGRGGAITPIVVFPGKDGQVGTDSLPRALSAGLRGDGDRITAKAAKQMIAARLDGAALSALPSRAEAAAIVERLIADPTDGPLSDAEVETPEARAIRIRDELIGNNTTITDRELAQVLLRESETAEDAEDLYQIILSDADTLTVSVDTGTGERRLTTRAVANAESRLLSRAREQGESRRHAIPAAKVRRAIDRFDLAFWKKSGRKFRLSAEQRQMIEHITAGGDLAIAEGAAGAGKSTAMEAAAEIWDQAGYKVVGAAPSGKAAKNLEDSGIASSMMHALAARLEKELVYRVLRETQVFGKDARASLIAAASWQMTRAKGKDGREAWEQRIEEIGSARGITDLSEKTRQWVMEEVARVMADPVNKKTVVVIDEAGMAGHALSNKVQAMATAAGAKLVLVGDREQLQPIDAGAAFRVQGDLAGTVSVSQVIRQRSEWMQEATTRLREGGSESVATAVAAYDAAGAIQTGIRGIDVAAEIDRAERILGQKLSLVEKSAMTTVIRYVDARQVSGAAWKDGHPDFQKLVTARRAVASEVAALGDRAHVWLQRYGVRWEDFGYDVLQAEAPGRRDAIQQRLLDRTTIERFRYDPKPDVRLQLDGRVGARQAVVDAWAEMRDRGTTAMLAYRRDDVADLNKKARAILRKRGEDGPLRGSDITISTEDGPVDLAVGDRILTTRNSKKLGLTNGDLGFVEKISRTATGHVLTVRFDDGRRVTIDTDVYNDISLGYAFTYHKSQGSTFDSVVALHQSGSVGVDRHLAYVGASRHRDDLVVVSAAVDAMTTEGVKRAWSTERTKTAIVDHLEPGIDLAELVRAGGVEDAERRSVRAGTTDALDRVFRPASDIPAETAGPEDGGGLGQAASRSSRPYTDPDLENDSRQGLRL